MQDEKPRIVPPGLGLDAALPRDTTAKREGRPQQHARGESRQNFQEARSGSERPVARLPNHRGAATVKRIEQRLTVVPPQRIAAADTFRLQTILPSIPATKPAYGVYVGFALCVLLPMLVASIYFGLIASDQYVAEFRFSVQDTTPGASSSANSLLAIAGVSGGAGNNDNYLVADFLKSRAAVDELQKRINVINLYSKPTIDWWSRFDSSKPVENFLNYWQGVVTANYDQVTGIATATVRAFTADDAFLVASTMVKLSEDLVNHMANRSETDAVRFAEKEVERAQTRLKTIRAKLTEYRNRVGVIDPTTSVAASNSTLIQTLRANLAQLETQLTTFQRQNLQPTAPAIVTLKNQINSTKEQLARTEADVGRGSNGSALSTIVGEYEQLNLEVQFAQAMVTSTMQALDQARANAAAQHLYITPYVRPSLPQSSTYPRRLVSIAMVGAIAFAFWMIGLLVIRSIRERFA